MKVFRRIISVALIICLLSVQKVAALGYYYNRKGDSVTVPDAYVYSETLDGDTLGIGSFNAIKDLYVDKEGRLYIADTGNNRIVVINPDNTLNRVVDKLIFNNADIKLDSPEGVFYKDGELYICNTGSGEIFVGDDSGNLVRKYLRPESASLPENTEYKPSKVAVNAAGSVFVQANGVYQGLVQYNKEGGFINFFGATEIEVTPTIVLRNMWKSLFSEEQREGLTRTISSELSNLFIDSEDFIFTVTASADSKQVRRLNAAGENILKYPGYDDTSLFSSGYNRNNFGDQESDYSKGQLVISEICDVHIDSDGILSVLDTTRGKIFQFDLELNPICVFGGLGEQGGYFRKAVSIEKRDNNYLIADTYKNVITVMKPTEYINKIRLSLALYNKGNYEGATEGWEEILNLNPSFSIAYRSIGRALLQQGNASRALEYLREGDDRYYYSLAMQQYRRDFIRNNWMWVVPVFILTLLIFTAGLLRFKKWLTTPNVKGGKRK